MEIFFIHGKDSSSQGHKATLLKKILPEIHCYDYTGSVEERMQQLYEKTTHYDKLLFIGSSLGGLMAALYALDNPEKVTGLLLLAPAIAMIPNARIQGKSFHGPVFIIHGKNDDIVPIKPTLDRALDLFSCLEIRIVEDSHRLKQTAEEINWPLLIKRIRNKLPLE